MILLQSQPFGRRDPWAVVNHAAAASALRAVCTVLHQLIQLSLSGARPVNDPSRQSRRELSARDWAAWLTVLPASSCRGSCLPRERKVRPQSRRAFSKSRGVAGRATSECVISTGGPGRAENRGGSGAPFVVPCRLSGGSRRQGYAILEVWGFERCRRGKSTDPRVPIPVFAESQILEC